MALEDYIIFVKNLISDADRLLEEEPNIEPLGNEDTIEYLRRALNWVERCRTELVPLSKQVEDNIQSALLEKTFNRLHITGWSCKKKLTGSTADKIKRKTSEDIRSSRIALTSLLDFISDIPKSKIPDNGMIVKPNPFLLRSKPREVIPNQIFSVFSWNLKDTTYSHVKKILEKEGYSVKYAGDRNGQVVFEDIWQLMTESEVVLVDFTERRPNVYLEFGMAIVLGKPIIALTQKKEDLPSDTPNLKYILYKDSLGDQTLEKELVKAIKDRLTDFSSL